MSIILFEYTLYYTLFKTDLIQLFIELLNHTRFNLLSASNKYNTNTRARSNVLRPITRICVGFVKPNNIQQNEFTRVHHCSRGG